MSKRTDITDSPPRLAYSCRCGWLDLGHMDSTSHRRWEGAQSLWDQITKESGPQSNSDPTGFQVGYQQTHGKKLFKGVVLRDGVTKTYWVKRGLTLDQKKSVALAIFMEVSMGFEAMQSNWLYRHVTDSGFSAEDLVSDLIGFYRAIDSTLDPNTICGVVSTKASLEVWDNYGPVGEHKNRTFEPLFFPCSECQCGKSGMDSCKSGTHSYGRFRVTVGEDGKILVRHGDWLSKYSAAMYQGDVTHVDEFGRLKHGRMERITQVNLIRSGETIYHIPTHEFSKNPKPGNQKQIPWTGPLPPPFRQIVPVSKGTLFRDWDVRDMSEEEWRRLGVGGAAFTQPNVLDQITQHPLK